MTILEETSCPADAAACDHHEHAAHDGAARCPTRLAVLQTPNADAEEEETSYRLHRRFDRFGRLVGDGAMAQLFRSHVMVIGLGGVGSFAAESLARSGVGRLTLVDFDRVCITNSNRQLQAFKGSIGKHKAHVLGERLASINPQARVEPLTEFYAAASADVLLERKPDFIVDAIDNMTAKCHLLAECRRRGLRVVSSLGSAGRIDPTAIAVGDLAQSKFCPMAADVRRILRQKYDFPRQGSFGIPAVYSTEVPREPIELTYDQGQGFRCVCPGGKNMLHSCEDRRVIYGSASFVTGTFGLFCASVAVRGLLES